MEELLKAVEIDGERYIAKKLGVFDSFPIAMIIMRKLPALFELVSPMLDNKESSLSQGDTADSIDMMEQINLLSDCIGSLGEEEARKIIETSLKHISKCLPAGDIPVMNKNGTFGVEGFEYDMKKTLWAVKEVLLFNLTGFFPESSQNLAEAASRLSQ